MSISRRSFLEQSAFGAAALAVLGVAPGSMAWTSALKRAANIKIGGPDWSLRLEGKIQSSPPPADKPALVTGELKAGQSRTGWLAFDLPEPADTLLLEYRFFGTTLFDVQLY